ncbi:hypothetical protein K0M31_002358 [Melipona bicolor]|uniref:Uncharacterized protein n=1 Tax=Melipona bicolor TaxID=60889 RepID=A0AA40GHK8_9HYME|nr:hypothetical protein K0M31_002358 [Melipona bicolor]
MTMSTTVTALITLLKFRAGIRKSNLSRVEVTLASIQPVARASATTGTAPTAKFDSTRRRRDCCEYQRNAKDTPSVQRAPRSSQEYSHPAGPAARIKSVWNSAEQRSRRDDVIRDLIRLIAFDPSYNAPTRIDTRTIRDVFFLRTLDFRNNTINRSDSNAFLPLYNLHTLEPSKNRLHNLGAQLFNRPFVLSRLTLLRNSIANLKPLAFRDCSNLKELYLSETEQITVPYAPRDFALLKTLDHGENRSSLYNSSFRNLDQLIGSRTRITYRHVVIHGKINTRREPLFPDIDDAHHANDLNIIKLTMVTPEVRNDAGGFLAANYGKQQHQDDCITSDNEIVGSSHSIEILQTQYLLKTSHENNVTAETVHNSLPGFSSKKLKFQTDKTLSSLLLELRRASEQEHPRIGRSGSTL